MATKVQEIDALGTLLAPLQVARVYKEDFPLEYFPNSLGIRWQGDVNFEMTNALYRVRNSYQIVYFGPSMYDCLVHADEITALIGKFIGLKIQIGNTEEYVQVMGFKMSPTFKTDTDDVYAVQGIVEIESNQCRDDNGGTPKYMKMQHIKYAINEGGF